MFAKPKTLPFWASALTLLGVLVLVDLGTWQLKRLTWKQDLIAQLDTAYKGKGDTPLDLAQDFTYGRIEGKFLSRRALLLGPKTHNSKIGNYLIVPLALKEKTLFVNLGWTEIRDINTLPIHSAKNKTVSFEGLYRIPRWNSFTPENDPENDLWYRTDTKEIAAAKGLQNPLPGILYAEQASYKFDAAFPNNTRQYPKNDHLQYALFWFAMAGALIVIYALRFLRKQE